MSDGILKPINYQYGLLPKDIMRNNELSIQAKGLYAYLIAYAGSQQIAFPSVDLIKHELGISNNTFNKYMKELKDLGCVSVSQERTNKGVFKHNVYQLHPYPKNPYTVNPSTVNPYTEISTTINNNLTSNNITSNKDTIAPKAKDLQNVLARYSSLNLPNYRKITNQREKAILARVKEHGLDDVLHCLDIASKSEFLNKPEHKWYSIDWIFNPTNFVKILEGKYSSENKPDGTKDFISKLKGRVIE